MSPYSVMDSNRLTASRHRFSPCFVMEWPAAGKWAAVRAGPETVSTTVSFRFAAVWVFLAFLKTPESCWLEFNRNPFSKSCQDVARTAKVGSS